MTYRFETEQDYLQALRAYDLDDPAAVRAAARDLGYLGFLAGALRRHGYVVRLGRPAPGGFQPPAARGGGYQSQVVRTAHPVYFLRPGCPASHAAIFYRGENR